MAASWEDVSDYYCIQQDHWRRGLNTSSARFRRLYIIISVTAYIVRPPQMTVQESCQFDSFKLPNLLIPQINTPSCPYPSHSHNECYCGSIPRQTHLQLRHAPVTHSPVAAINPTAVTLCAASAILLPLSINRSTAVPAAFFAFSSFAAALNRATRSAGVSFDVVKACGPVGVNRVASATERGGIVGGGDGGGVWREEGGSEGCRW